MFIHRIIFSFFGIDLDTEKEISEKETTKKENSENWSKKYPKKDSKIKEISITEYNNKETEKTTSKGIEIKNPATQKEGEQPLYKDFKKNNSTKTIDIDKNNGFIIDIEKIEGKGEDAPPLLIAFQDGSNIIGVADGMGGAGGTVYDIDYAKRSGAYLASRAINSITTKYFLDFKQTGYEIDESNSETIAKDLKYHFDTGLAQILDKIHKTGNSKSNLKSSLIKRLPTTFSLCYIKPENDKIKLFNFWAGDSRVYALSHLSGLHQLTKDDLMNKGDAYENLINDSPLSNCIHADKNYKINTNYISIDSPVVIFSTTDGSFGYLHTPLHFEQLLIETLNNSFTIDNWKKDLEKEFKKTQSDDVSLSLIILGYSTFNELKDSFYNRQKLLQKELEKISKIDKDLNVKEKIIDDVNVSNKEIILQVEKQESSITNAKDRFNYLIQTLNSFEYDIKNIENKIVDKKREIIEMEQSIQRIIIDVLKTKEELDGLDKDILLQKNQLSQYIESNKINNPEDVSKELKSLKEVRDKIKLELWVKYKNNYENYLKSEK